ncbi:NADH:flavin oxidoreductase [Saccharopolyspora cebuensis]|uniref:NADH:flavin oxidoreductase n=1 Tax=Saccharopolyspora cebuensis TaxID=418759 RepID=A0ABV4CJW5_9PSEU
MDTPAQHHGAAEDVLFDPVTVGGRTLVNRAALAPMTRVSATAEGLVTDRNARYYAGFARGGFGLIITEGVYTDTEHSQGYLHQPGLATPAQERSWRPVVEAVHAEGGAIFAQLMHAGAQAQGNRFRHGTVGPSAVAPRGEQLGFYRGEGPYPTPEPLDAAQLAEIRREFAAAARRAAAAGFDGVELHGANGYLLDQFLTDYLNQRDDEYGGGIENRLRLAAEVCDEVLQAVGSEIAVGIRISQSKVSDLTYRWPGGVKDAETIFETLARTGAHFLHTTEYRATAAAFDAGQATLAELAKQHSGLPVIANGHLEDPDTARFLLRTGAADVIAIGKAALAQHDWPHRARDGHDIVGDPHPGTLQPLADIKDWELDG